MPKGQQTRRNQIFDIMYNMFETNNYLETSRRLNIPVSTVKYLYDKHVQDEEYIALRKKRDDEFAENASRIIAKAMKRLEKKIDNEEENLSLTQLTTAIGTLYDKKALATGRSTNNTTVNVENFLSNVMDEEEY